SEFEDKVIHINRCAKLKRRPPFTTFAQRLMWMTLSSNSESSSRPRPICWLGFITFSCLEFQSTFTSSIGQCLDASVIDVTAAVENDGGDLLSECALSDHLAERL